MQIWASLAEKVMGRTGIISLAQGESRWSLELCLIGGILGGGETSRVDQPTFSKRM